MSMIIKSFILGPIQNNTYLVADEETGHAAIVDPAAPSKEISSYIEKHGWKLKYIWITHAHFDHIGGVKWFQSLNEIPVPVAMHPLDMDLWKDGGGSKNFGFDFNSGSEPDFLIQDHQIIKLGDIAFEVLHTPGHTRGHVTFASKQDRVAFCGDLIFLHGIGRSDLDDSDEDDLYTSIREKIFTLPDDTILYPGHGPQTIVKEEKENNPFLCKN